jgi:hypothetical protein
MTYSSSVAVNRRRSIRRNQNTVSVIDAAKTLGPVSNSIILIVLACLIFMLYLTQVTRTNNYGPIIHNLQDQQSQLQDTKTQLEVDSARYQSIKNVASSQVAKKMTAVSPAGTLR